MFFQRLLCTFRGEASPTPRSSLLPSQFDLRRNRLPIQQNRRNLRIRQINFKQELVQPRLKIQGYRKAQAADSVANSQALPRGMTERRQKSHLKGTARSSTVTEGKAMKSQPLTRQQEDKQERVESLRPAYQLKPETEAKIKAYSYAVLQPFSLQVMVSSRAQVSLEVASLTKVMTCFTVLEIARLHSLAISQQSHVISTKSERMAGTSAQILGGEIYTVEQLLYAMMLPSGNDAAIALAEWGGGVLRGGVADGSATQEELRDNVSFFIRQMNKIAARLGLRNSKWTNPHGLSDQMNKSTAYDMARLCSFAVRDPVIRKITSTRQYRTTICTVEGLEYPVEWENTNKLLGKQGYFGIKTGVTSTAGPCMASAYQHEGHCFVVVILRTSKLSRRFRDSKIVLLALLKEMARGGDKQRQELFLHFKRTKQEEESEQESGEEQFQFEDKDAQSLRKRELIVKNMC